MKYTKEYWDWNNSQDDLLIKRKTDNELIAEFMNLRSTGLSIYKESDYKYHKSWDWLMPVVVKLFDDEYNEFDGVGDLSFRLNDTLLETNLDSLYSIVVEFINEYNKTI